MEGVPVKIGDKTYTVPKLRVGTFRRASEIISEVDGIDPNADVPLRDKLSLQNRWFSAHARGIVELLRRNYPDLKVEEIEEELDCDSVTVAFFDVLRSAGRKVDEQGEAKSP